MALTKVSYSMIEGATVNILDKGADPTGVTGSSAAIQAALAEGKTVFIPDGEFRLDVDVNVPSDSVIVGNGEKSILKCDDGFGFRFKGATLNDRFSNIHFKGLHFKCSTTSTFYGILGGWIDTLSILECVATNCALVKVEWGGSGTYNDAYNFITDVSDLNSDINISNNYIDPAVGQVGVPEVPIWLFYVKDFSVTNNTIKNPNLGGVLIWGADTDAARTPNQAALTYRRWATNGILSGNTVSDTLGAYLFFMGVENSAMTGNSGFGSLDAGFDLEGCIGCTVSGNSSFNAKRGGITQYSPGRDNIFIGNVVTADDAPAPIFGTSYSVEFMGLDSSASSPTTIGRSAIFKDNVFAFRPRSSSTVVNYPEFALTPNTLVSIEGNTFINTRYVSSSSSYGMDVINNKFILENLPTTPLAAPYVSVGSNGSLNANYNNPARFNDNQIINTTGTLVVGTGLFIDCFNFENFQYTIKGNSIKGFSTSIIYDVVNQNGNTTVHMQENIFSGAVSDASTIAFSSLGRNNLHWINNYDEFGRPYYLTRGYKQGYFGVFYETYNTPGTHLANAAGKGCAALGAYNPATPYNLYEYVSYGGSVYRSLLNSNAGNQPDISPAAWTLAYGSVLTFTDVIAL